MGNKTGFPRAAFSAIAFGCFLALAAPAAFPDDAEQAKLKELQRALTTTPEETAPVFSTKAIVFDKDPGAARAEAPTPQASPQTATDCGLMPADVKTTAVDFEIQFRLGSADLSPASVNTLVQIAKILSLTPGRCVFVEGHTDSIGNPDSNLALSRERANTVVKFIVEKSGIQRDRLIAAGKGSTEPLRNLDPRSPKNRRVTFKVAG